MRFSSNHDENAWDSPDVIKFGSDGAKLAAVFVNTLPGVPLLYNGQEAGNAKKLGLFEKDSIDWSGGADFRKLYTALFAIRKSHPALSGSMTRIPTSNEKQVYAFTRVSGADRIIVALNFSKEKFNGTVRLLSPEIITSNHISAENLIDGASETASIPSSGAFPLSLPPLGFRILSISQSSR